MQKKESIPLPEEDKNMGRGGGGGGNPRGGERISSMKVKDTGKIKGYPIATCPQNVNWVITNVSMIYSILLMPGV